MNTAFHFLATDGELILSRLSATDIEVFHKSKECIKLRNTSGKENGFFKFINVQELNRKKKMGN